ncbi:MAG: PIN domain-containing protein [Bacteroidaceae bacterium]|nr:PIN domain-containing protein [Bacteroidaceae bacterium]
MRIFLDTNVVLDYLTSRGDEKATGKIFDSIDSGENTGFISIGSFYTIIYLTERFLKDSSLKNPMRLARMREILSKLLESLEIAGHSREDLLIATNDLQFNDLEDSCQLQAAKASSCPCLITTNKKDFRKSDSTAIEILTPKEFTRKYISNK